MTSGSLGPLLVDSVDPVALESFWARVLGRPAQQALLAFRPQRLPKTVKNRVHLDLYARDIAPLLEFGACVLGDYDEWSTLADIEGNEFCVFPDASLSAEPPARAFAVCTDSDRPEELAAWWANRVGTDVRDGPDGTPRWLHGPPGWEGLIWKFVRVADERLVPNRWQWTFRSDVMSADNIDPQGNEFGLI